MINKFITIGEIVKITHFNLVLKVTDSTDNNELNILFSRYKDIMHLQPGDIYLIEGHLLNNKLCGDHVALVKKCEKKRPVREIDQKLLIKSYEDAFSLRKKVDHSKKQNHEEDLAQLIKYFDF